MLDIVTHPRRQIHKTYVDTKTCCAPATLGLSDGEIGFLRCCTLGPHGVFFLPLCVFLDQDHLGRSSCRVVWASASRRSRSGLGPRRKTQATESRRRSEGRGRHGCLLLKQTGYIMLFPYIKNRGHSGSIYMFFRSSFLVAPSRSQKGSLIEVES